MLAFVLLFLIFVLYLWKQRKNFCVWWKIGGPFGYPFIGYALHFIDQKSMKLCLENSFFLENNINIFSENLHTVQKISKKYGTFCGGWLGMNFMVIISDPALAKTALNLDACIDKSSFFTVWAYLMKNGITLEKGNLNFSI